MIKTAYGSVCLSRKKVFSDGRATFEDDPHLGTSKTSRTDKSVEIVA